MSFDEIQSIWNSQTSAPAVVDDEALTKQIRARHRSFTRIVGMVEIAMTLMLLFVAAMFMRDPLVQGHDRILIVPGIASLLAAVFVWTGRIARKKREIRYESSLAGILQQSIAAIDYQVKRMRGFIWWFAAPMALGLVVGLFLVDDSKRLLFYTIFIPGFALGIGFACWQIRREVRRNLLPEKARLEDLWRTIVGG